MRILTVSAQKPHSTGSGVYLSELVKAFDALGCAQAVVAGVYAEDAVSLPQGARFFPVYFHSDALPFPIAGMSDEMPYESTVYDHMTPEMTAQFRAAFLSRVKEAVDAFQPDMILCHHLYLLTALVREAFPYRCVCGVCHGSDLRKLKQNPLWRDYIRTQIRGLTHIFCLHEEQKKTLCSLCGVSPERVAVVGSGYNSDVFYRMDDVPPHAGYSIVYAGKIARKKGVLSLIRALDALPYASNALTVRLAGGYANADYADVRALIEQCRYPVELLGNLSQHKLARLLNACDLFVLPSFYEGLPLVLIEAIACGAKAICTDLPGIRDWMDAHAPQNGVRFIPPPRMLDADEPAPEALPAFEKGLANAIQDMLEAPALPAPDLRGVSWTGVAQRILEAE